MHGRFGRHSIAAEGSAGTPLRSRQELYAQIYNGYIAPVFFEVVNFLLALSVEYNAVVRTSVIAFVSRDGSHLLCESAIIHSAASYRRLQNDERYSTINCYFPSQFYRDAHLTQRETIELQVQRCSISNVKTNINTTLLFVDPRHFSINLVLFNPAWLIVLPPPWRVSRRRSVNPILCLHSKTIHH